MLLCRIAAGPESQPEAMSESRAAAPSPPIDVATLSQMLAFFVQSALYAGRGWGSVRHEQQVQITKSHTAFAVTTCAVHVRNRDVTLLSLIHI